MLSVYSEPTRRLCQRRRPIHGRFDDEAFADGQGFPERHPGPNAIAKNVLGQIDQDLGVAPRPVLVSLGGVVGEGGQDSTHQPPQRSQ